MTPAADRPPGFPFAIGTCQRCGKKPATVMGYACAECFTRDTSAMAAIYLKAAVGILEAPPPEK